MFETTVKIGGMMCGMCEAHVNDVVRKAVLAKRVSSSHTKGETVLLTEQQPDEQALRAAISETGYDVLSVSTKPYEKHGLFGFLKK